MTLKEFVAKVGLPRTVIEKALLFAFFQTKNSSRDEFLTQTILPCFEDLNLTKPNITRLKQGLQKTRKTVKGRSNGYFKLEYHYLTELENRYGSLFESTVTPNEKIRQGIDLNATPFLTPSSIGDIYKMAEVYAIYACFENSARNFISFVLEPIYGKDWWKRVQTREIKDKINLRKQEEKRNKWHTIRRNSNDLYYADFDDLALVIIKEWQNFKSYFPDQHWVKTRLGEAGKSRNIVAHSCILPDREIDRLKLYFGDWCKQVRIGS